MAKNDKDNEKENKEGNGLDSLLGGQESKQNTEAVAKLSPVGPAISSEEIEEKAFSIFKERACGHNSKQIAIQCFRDAESFGEARRMFRNKEFVSNEEDEILNDCFLKNAAEDHPVNLASRKMGNLKEVIRVHKELEENPKIEKYDRLKWDKNTTQLARDIFPAVVERAKKKMERAGQTVGAN